MCTSNTPEEIRKEFLVTRDREVLFIIENNENKAITLNGEMVALLLVNAVPNEITQIIQGISSGFRSNERNNAGTMWGGYEGCYAEAFRKLSHGQDIETAPEKFYIFPDASGENFRVHGEKRHQSIAYEIMRDEDENFIGFFSYDLSSVVEKEYKNLSEKVKETLDFQGSFKEGNKKGKFIYQKDGEKVKIGKINKMLRKAIKKVNSCQVGAESCKKSGPKKKDRCTNPFLGNDVSVEISQIKNWGDRFFGELLELSKINKSDNDKKNKIFNFLQQQNENANKLRYFCGKGGFFSTVNINRTQLNQPTTNFHKDKNIYHEGLALLVATGKGYTGGETIFPELSYENKIIGFNLREGSALLFKSNLLQHGNMKVSLNETCTTNSKWLQNKGNRRSVVFYLNKKLERCSHHSSQELDQVSHENSKSERISLVYDPRSFGSLQPDTTLIPVKSDPFQRTDESSQPYLYNSQPEYHPQQFVFQQQLAYQQQSVKTFQSEEDLLSNDFRNEQNYQDATDISPKKRKREDGANTDTDTDRIKKKKKVVE